MEGRATLLLLMLLLSASLTMANMCDICTCGVFGPLYSVNCQCSRDLQKLDFTLGILQTSPNKVDILHVSQCPEVVFRNGLVNGLTQLKTLTVSNVSSLRIEANSMGNMSSMVVQDVDKLELEPRALKGMTINELRMINVAVGKLQKDTLDLRQIELLWLSNSEFSNIQPGAIHVDMGNNSHLFIGDCHFDNVGSRAVKISSIRKATVVRTSFESVKQIGFDVFAYGVGVVDYNSFGGNVDRYGLCITAEELNVTNNFYYWFPICLNRHSFSYTKRLLFKNNTVQIVTSALADIVGSNHVVDNSFNCSCRDFDRYPEKDIPDFLRKIYEENFCYSKKCPKSVTVATLQRHVQSGATCDDDKLCELSGSSSFLDWLRNLFG